MTRKMSINAVTFKNGDPIPNHFAPIRSIRVEIDLAKCLCEQIFKKNFSMVSHRCRSVLQPRLRARSQ